MDSILESYLNDFRTDFAFVHEELPKLFEHFVNYCVITKVDSDRGAIEAVNVGGKHNPGIDGLAIIVNDHVVTTKEQIDYFLELLGRLEVEFVFIQSKTSEKFEMTEIGSFLTCATEFFNNNTTMTFGDDVLNLMDLKNYILTKSIKIERNPTVRLFYATCGKWQDDVNIMATVQSHVARIKSFDIFTEVNFYPIDRDAIKKSYREIKNAITREIEFEKHTILPTISNVTESFIGILPGNEYLKLITDDNGDLLRNIFYDNVRDFQGFNSVNSEIRETIDVLDRKDKFALLNNGVTIVAKKVNKLGYRFKISDFQIVNGCQTSHVLYHLRTKVDSSVYVPVKLIITDNYDVTSSIVKATNRQTEVKSEAFEILSPFHKKLEEFYEAMRKKYDVKVHYERRSHQFEGANIDRSNIVTLSNQVSSFISMFYNEPHVSAQRYYGELLKLYKSKLFSNEHSLFPYFISGLAFSKLERLFQIGRLPGNLKRFKHHMLMLLRYACGGDAMPRLNSKDMQGYCERILHVLLDEAQFVEKAKQVASTLGRRFDTSSPGFRNIHTSIGFLKGLVPAGNEDKATGEVRYYNDQRGFGFINIGSSMDVFFHISEYRRSLDDDPILGERLSFDIADSDNGKKAINISKAKE